MMAMRQQTGNAFVIVLLIVAIVGVFAAGYFYNQSRQPTVSQTGQLRPSPQASSDMFTIAPSPSASLAQPTSSPVVNCAASTVVVFDAAGSISATDKTQLQARIVDPFLDYHCDLNGIGYVVSLSIGKNTGASQAQYPYSAKAIYKNGANEGFLIMKTGATIDWWLPECMGACPFSDSFKLKYPEIVAKSP